MKTIKDKIKCPECLHIQDAEIEVREIWNVFIHTCECCNYLIMESEWDSVKQTFERKNN